MATQRQLNFLQAQVEKAVESLGEQFEAVQILATLSDEDGSYAFRIGAGNIYARLGLARDFIEKDRFLDQAQAIAKALGSDDGDEWKTPPTGNHE